MIQLTEEQQKRLKQIRERQRRSMRPDRDDVPQRSADPLARALSRELRQAQTDRSFLLSLYDPQLAENERLNSIVSAYENQDEEALAEAYKNP